VNLGSEISEKQTPAKPHQPPTKPHYESLKISESVKTLGQPETAQQPLLFLEVSLTQEKTVQLFIYEGENVKQKLHEFCKLHSLGKDKKQKLIDVVNEQMKSILPRIDEVDSATDEVVQL